MSSDSAKRRNTRLQNELKRMTKDPPHGIGMWAVSDSLENLEALIEGPENSPFENGEFRLSITIPPNYPNVPPLIKFKTKIYHPNIDSQGRICLDSLKQEPIGSWRPSLNLSTVLAQIRILLVEPNVNDPLELDIAKQLQEHPEQYKEKAKKMTEQYAKPHVTNEGTLEESAKNDDDDDEEEESE